MRSLVWSAVPAAVCAALSPAAPAFAQPAPPQLGAPCAADLADAMTLLPDQQTYAVCEQDVWTAAPIVFEPHDRWYSYGPVITLHGQGMRNPQVTAGEVTATPLSPDTVCRISQQTVVEAGVLSAPEMAQGDPGQPLSVQLQPKLFYLELSGDCLWEKN